MQKVLLVAAVFITALSRLGYAQTTTNPDISFIGDFRAAWQDAKNSADKGKTNFDLHELELAASGHLNPYARADLNISFGAEGVDLEEAYITVLRGLPGGLQLKAGKYLVDFGKLNTQHPHQWLWLERPLMYRTLFGEEGWKDAGVQLNTLLPVGKQALGLSANWIQSGGLITEEDSELPYTPERTEPAASGRVSIFSPVSEFSNLELGISGMRAQFNPVAIEFQSIPAASNSTDLPLADFTPEKRYSFATAVDGKWKWKPDNYNGIQIVGEYVTQTRKLQDVAAIEHAMPGAGDTTYTVENRLVTSHGAFLAGELRFRRRFDVGAFYDYAQAATSKDEFQSGYGVYGAFSIAEETTRFGLVLRRNETMGADPYHTATFQILWSLGPHKAHTF